MSQLSRDEMVSYARAILRFIAPGQTYGEGWCALWHQQVPTSMLTTKTRVEMKVEEGREMICLYDVRSWNPGMRMGKNFKSGPGVADLRWKVAVGWVAYLRFLGEVTSYIHGKDPEAATKEKARKPRGPAPKR